MSHSFSVHLQKKLIFKGIFGRFAKTISQITAILQIIIAYFFFFNQHIMKLASEWKIIHLNSIIF